MKRAGKVSILTLIVIVAVFIGATILVVFANGDSPDAAAAKFMDGLVRGDVDELVQVSDMGDESPEQVRKEWDFTIHEVAPYYHFKYFINGTTMNGSKDAVANVTMDRNYGKPASYDEQMQIPMVKDGDIWKVDVRSLNREFFPGLPE